jgi:hypothetical protein
MVEWRGRNYGKRFPYWLILACGCHSDSLIELNEGIRMPHCLGAPIMKTNHSKTLHPILGQNRDT